MTKKKKKKYGLKILVRDRLRWIAPQVLAADPAVLREAIARLSPRDGWREHGCYVVYATPIWGAFGAGKSKREANADLDAVLTAILDEKLNAVDRELDDSIKTCPTCDRTTIKKVVEDVVLAKHTYVAVPHLKCTNPRCRERLFGRIANRVIGAQRVRG